MINHWAKVRLEAAIEAYEPQNAQEKADKEVFLECMRNYQNLLTRETLIAHFTASGWIVNKDRTKTLLVHHNLYRSWSWTGGHADDEADLLEVAIREAKEETGLQIVKPVSEEIFALDVLPVWSHMRKRIFVPSHLHLNLAYLLEADEEEALTVLPTENSDVKWVYLDEVNQYSTEVGMHPVYNKLISRLRAMIRENGNKKV